MNFLRTRAEQLVDHLRECIARGEVANPLPNTRDWSSKLGVARGTLEAALGILKREGLMQVRAREGTRLRSLAVRSKANPRESIVRWIYYARDYADLSKMQTIDTTSERLLLHGIRSISERCNMTRLEVIQRSGEFPHELLVLVSLRRRFQKMFEHFQKSALVVGHIFPGVSLPCLCIDVISAVRHATYMLARRGFRSMDVVMKEGSQTPFAEILREICTYSPRPIHGEIIKMPMGFNDQVRAAQRLAARCRAGHAIVAIYPIPANLLITALLQRGLRVPEQIEVVAVNTDLQSVRAVPVPTYYPYPVERFDKALCRIAVRYFEEGSVPPIRKLIPLTMVPTDA